MNSKLVSKLDLSLQWYNNKNFKKPAHVELNIPQMRVGGRKSVEGRGGEGHRRRRRNVEEVRGGGGRRRRKEGRTSTEKEESGGRRE